MYKYKYQLIIVVQKPNFDVHTRLIVYYFSSLCSCCCANKDLLDPNITCSFLLFNSILLTLWYIEPMYNQSTTLRYFSIKHEWYMYYNLLVFIPNFTTIQKIYVLMLYVILQPRIIKVRNIFFDHQSMFCLCNRIPYLHIAFVLYNIMWQFFDLQLIALALQAPLV